MTFWTIVWKIQPREQIILWQSDLEKWSPLKNESHRNNLRITDKNCSYQALFSNWFTGSCRSLYTSNQRLYWTQLISYRRLHRRPHFTALLTIAAFQTVSNGTCAHWKQPFTILSQVCMHIFSTQFYQKNSKSSTQYAIIQNYSSRLMCPE